MSKIWTLYSSVVGHFFIQPRKRLYSRVAKSNFFGFQIEQNRMFGSRNIRFELLRIEPNANVRFGPLVWISDSAKCLKSEQNCSDFRRLKLEQFDNQTIMLCPKSEHIRISALYCNSLCAFKTLAVFNFRKLCAPKTTRVR